MTEKEMTFEEAYRRLESIVESLEKGESSLEEALNAFEEGMKLAQFCAEKLSQAEARLKKLIKTENGTFHLEPLE